ncbi:Vomp family autotransporter [Bartonella sp. CM31XJBT]|uniref:Vomp family autotransporter n=2 Tax=unclassified Bartonella TaxID=2645622 RepID=UPI002362BBA1|nr:Vomp family autotransporter [Bartonella sp. CM31XJBT]
MLWNDDAHAFVARHVKNKEKDGQVIAEQENSKLKFLLDGEISKGSTEAITGNQLYSMNQTFATYFGGGAGYDKDGQWKAPSFKVKTVDAEGKESEESYNSVAEAFAGVASSITNVHNDVTNVVSDSLAKQDEKTKVINIGTEVEGTELNISNKDKVDRTLSGVKAAENDNEAVNKAQLDKSLKDLSSSLQSDDSAVVHYDKKDGDNGGIDYTSVTLGKGKDAGPVALHNVAEGNIAKDSRDAITGGQLYSLGDNVATYLGGGAEYKEGQWSAPSFKVKTVKGDGSDVEDKEYKTVAEALAGVGASITNVRKEINNEITNVVSDSLAKQDEKTKVINIGTEVEGSEINIANKDKGDRILSGVKEATKNNEAVNKEQLDKSLEKLSNNLQSDESAVVHYDKKDGDNGITNYASVTLGKGKGSASVGLHNVAEGQISENSHDAVNGGQISKVSQDIAEYLGGGTSFKDGTFTGPTYKLSSVDAKGEEVEKSYSDVGLAIESIDTNFKNVNSNLTNKFNELTENITNITQEVQGDALLWDKDAEAFVATHGEKESKSKITSLAAGSIVSGSSDAITGGQIYDLQKQFAGYFGGGAGYNEKGEWQDPDFQIQTFSNDGTKGDKKSSNNVAGAFNDINDSMSTINARIKEVSEGVAQDSLSWSKADGAFVALHGEKDGAKTNSKIKFLAAGDITKESTDAVNGSQLYSLGKDLASYLNGDAKYEKDQWLLPRFKVTHLKEDGTSEEAEYDSVSEALSGVGNSFTNVVKDFNDKVTNITQEVQGDALLWNKDAEAFVATHGGKDGEKTNSKITSLANGDITASSSDAVAGNQLYALGNSVAQSLGGDASYAGGAWTAPSFKVKTVNEDGTKVEEKKYDNVSEAFAGVGTSFENLQKEFTQNNTEVTENIKQNALLWSDEDNAFVAIHGEGAGKGNSKIKFLSNGEVSASSSDAINGSQLFDTNKTVASYLGGGAEYKEGQWSAPSFKVKIVKEDGSAVEEQSYDDVAKAFAGVGNSFTNIHKELKNEINQVVGDSLVKQDEKTHVISVGGEKSGTEVKLSNIDGAARILSGVKSGTLSEASSDAVNGSQLFATNQNVSSVSNNLETTATNIAKSLGGGAEYKEGQWRAPSFKVKTVNEDGSAVEEQSYDDVAKAFAGVGNSFTNIHKELQNEINRVVGDSLVKQDDATKVIKIGGEKEGSAITIANMNGDARSLSGVKAGTLSEGSTEAVNGSQLYSLNQTLATYFGGGAHYEDGQWVAPTFKVTTFNDDGSPEEHSYPNIAEAFAGVSNSFTKLHNEISDNIEQNALLWSDEDSAFVALHGKGDKRSKSKLKSVLDGDISEGSTEAITGNQLYSLHQTLAMYLGGGASYEGGEWRAPEFKVAQFNSDGSSSEKKIYHDVAGAFDGVSDGMTSINDRIHDVEKSVASNGLNWNEEEGAYDAKHDGKSSKITNVLDGKIEEGSQEVVNGGQLWSTNERVKEVEDKVDTIDQHVKDIEVAVTDGVVNYDKDSDGKKTNSITLVGGNDSEPVMIDNVAAGKIATGSQQAVNGGQLHDYTEEQMKIVLEDANKYTDEKVSGLVNDAVNESKSYTDIKFETLNYAIQDVRKEARQAAAIGLAVSNLSYDDTPGKLSFSFGTGVWRSQSALALGAGYMSENGRFRSNVSATSSGGHWGVGAGFRVTLN